VSLKVPENVIEVPTGYTEPVAGPVMAAVGAVFNADDPLPTKFDEGL